MNVHRLDAMHRVTLDSLDIEESWSPDGLTPDDVREIQWDAYRDIARERRPEPTAWLLMDDEERAEIRPSRRLRSVPALGTAAVFSAPTAGGEAA
jgi:hypothetical protein